MSDQSETVKGTDERDQADAVAGVNALSPQGGTPPDIGLDVIFSDDDMVVLNKPSGLRTVPGKVVGKEAETKAHVRVF